MSVSTNATNSTVRVAVTIASYSRGVGKSVTLFNKNLVADASSGGVEINPVLPSEPPYRCIHREVGQFVSNVMVRREDGVSGVVNFRSTESAESSFSSRWVEAFGQQMCMPPKCA